MAQKPEQVNEQEEFEFRRRFELEQGGSTQAQPEVAKPKPDPGFWDQHPDLRMVMRHGLPLAAAVGTMPFTGGMSLPTLLAAEGVASLGAEGLNQAIGVNEPDTTQQALALAAPGIGRSVGGLLSNIPRMVPGFGEALRAAITPEMRALPEKLLGKDTAQALYSALGKQVGPNQQITAFPALSQAVKELETESSNVPWASLQQKLKGGGHGELFDQIKESIQGVAPTMGMTKPTVGGKPFNLPGFPATMQVTNPGKPAGLNFDEARAAVEGLGRAIGSTADGAERGTYKKLYNAMLSDLEKAPMPASGNLELWKQARQAYKLEKAKFSLQEATERAIKTKDGIDIIDPNQIVKWLRTHDDVKSRVSPTEYRAILNEYRHMASVAGHNMSKFTAMVVGGFASGGAGGALAGYLGAEQLSKVMMTESGRKIVRAFASDPSRSNFRRFTMAAGVEAQASIPDGESIPLVGDEEN